MNQELNKDSENQKNKRLKLFFRISLLLGILGLLDILSKPIVTPIVEEYFGKSLEGTQVSLFMGIYMDMARNGANFLEKLFLELVLLLDGIWFFFFVTAYMIKRVQKRNLLKSTSNIVESSSTQANDIKIKKRKPLSLIGGVIGCLFGTWLLVSSLITGDFSSLVFFLGVGLIYGGVVSLKDFFKKL